MMAVLLGVVNGPYAVTTSEVADDDACGTLS